MASVVIDIATEFTGKKAFKQAETSADKLMKSVKKLGGALGLAFGTQQIIAFGKQAVKAFAESELETVQLTNAVKNLGLAFASRDIDIYIDKVERATGINRDQLQPAMLQLLRVTGSVTKSQELLNLAIDVAGSGTADLATASDILSQAYVGNFKGLKSLDLGFTNAELASLDFEKVQLRLQTLFAGQGKSAANSYIASINKLTIASEQASEKIGKSLLDALTAISGGDTVDDTVKKIDTLSSAIAGLIDVTLGLKAGEYLQRFYALRDGKIANGFGNRSLSVLSQDTQKADAAARKKVEADAKKRAAELLAIARRQQAAQAQILKDKRLAVLIDKAQLKIGKGTDIFDIEKVQIAAALTNQAEQLGKATNTQQVLQIANDTARLNVKRSILDVEEAIASKDTEAIENALKKLNGDLEVLGVLNNQKLTLIEIDKLLKTLRAADIKGTIQYSDNITETIKRLQELYKMQTDAENALLALKLKNAREIAGIENDTLLAKLRGYSASAQALVKLSGVEREAAVAKLASDIGAASFIQGITAGLSPADAATGARFAAQAAYTYYINITAGIGDPNAIAEEVNNILNEARNRGTLVGGVTIA
jgi:hypothetical protein